MIRELRCEESGLPISQCDEGHGHLNTEHAWGAYVPGRRIEIEPFGWDGDAIRGYGPSRTGDPKRRALVQRADESPHPITWHSQVHDDVDGAREALLMIRIGEAESEREAYLKIPGVSEIAFALHHALGGCNNSRSVAECDRRCVADAVEIVEGVLDQSDLARAGLHLIRPRGHTS